MDIGTLTGRVAIEDQFSGVLDTIGDKIKHFADGFTGEMAVVAGTVVGTVAAVAAMTAAVTALGDKGSEILGVENAFDKLAERAGTTGAALRGGLSEGVRGTISEFELMKETSRLMGSGMELNAEQAGLMGRAARELGKATGGDAASGLATLSSALTTGRVRGLQQQIGLIDLKKGEEEYAKSLGLTSSELDEQGKLEGKRIAIMGAVQGYVDRLGESELSFKEKISQGKEAVGEWINELATSVASSAAVGQALDAVKSALSGVTNGAALMGSAIAVIDAFADAVTVAAKVAGVWSDILGSVGDKVGFLLTAISDGDGGMKAFTDRAQAQAQAIHDSADAAAQAQINYENLDRMNKAMHTSFKNVNDASAEWIKRNKDGGAEAQAHKLQIEKLRIETEAHKVAVEGVVGSVLKSNKEISINRDAYAQLGDKVLFTKNAQDSFISTMDKMREAGIALNAEESRRYELITNDQVATLKYGETSLESHHVTLQQIESMKALGMTSAQIAEKFNSSAKAVDNYDAALKQMQGIEREIAGLEADWAGKSADKIHQQRTQAIQDALSTFQGTSIQLDAYVKDIDKKFDLMQKTGSEGWSAIAASSLSARQSQLQDQQVILDNMMSSGNFTRADIDKQRDHVYALRDAMHQTGTAAEGSQVSTDKWLSSMDKFLQGVIDKENELNKAMASTITYDLSTKSGMDYFKQMNPGASVKADSDYFKTHSIQDAVRDGLIDFYAGYKSGGWGAWTGSTTSASEIAASNAPRGAVANAQMSNVAAAATSAASLSSGGYQLHYSDGRTEAMTNSAVEDAQGNTLHTASGATLDSTGATKITLNGQLFATRGNSGGGGAAADPYAAFDKLNEAQGNMFMSGDVAGSRALTEAMNYVGSRPGYGFDNPVGPRIPTNTYVFNMNGVLLSSDPGGQAALQRAVVSALTKVTNGQRQL